MEYNVRKHTNNFFCYFYILIVLLMISVSIYGILKNNYAKLIAPFDGKNNMCGYSDGFTEFPYLFFTDLNETISFYNLLNSSVCVSECPK